MSEDGKIKFTSGRIMDPNFGTVGLNHKLEVSEGWDNPLNHKLCTSYEEGDWTAHWPDKDDLAELADIMIDRWTRFKTSLSQR